MCHGHRFPDRLARRLKATDSNLLRKEMYGMVGAQNRRTCACVEKRERSAFVQYASPEVLTYKEIAPHPLRLLA